MLNSLPASPGRTSSSSFEILIEIIVLGLLAYLPFALGGVFPISLVVLMTAAAAMALCFGLRCLIAREQEVVWTWAYVPLFLYLALVAFQLVPLGIDTLDRIASGNAGLWLDLTGTQNVPSASDPETATLSLYPWATRVDFRLLLSIGMIVLVASNVYRKLASAKRLLLGLALIGFAAAVLAFLQDLSGAKGIFWLYVPDRSDITGGPFVHAGHYCEFVNLSMGAALALLLVRASERSPGKQVRLDLQEGMARTDRILLAFLLLGIVTIALSGSRNGLMSLLLGAAVIFATMQHTAFMQGIGWPLVGMILAGFVGLLFLGFDPVYERMATLSELGEGYSTRRELVRDSLTMFQRFPAFGAGQGTYEITFPMFDTSLRAGTAAHAENQYIETLTETGWIGLGLVATLILIVFQAWRRLAWASSFSESRITRSHTSKRGIAFGLGFSLFAIAMHSTTDFGIKLPSIMALLAVLVATLLGLGSSRVSNRAVARLVCALFCFAGFGSLVAELPDAFALRTADAHWDRVDELEDIMGELPPEAKALHYDELVNTARKAADLQPEKIEYRYWAALHGWSRSYNREEAAQPPDSPGMWLEPTPTLSTAARSTQADLLEARWLAPTFGPLWSAVGQLGVRWLSDGAAARWIHLGRELAPHHPATCVTSAAQFMRDGQNERARATFERAIQMGASASGIVDILVLDLEQVDLAEELADGNLSLMIKLEGLLAKIPSEANRLAVLEQAILRKLVEACSEPNPPVWILTRLARHRVSEQKDEEAVSLYRRILNRVPGHGCRYQLAAALVRLGAIPEARMHLRDLISADPKHSGARDLLQGLGDR